MIKSEKSSCLITLENNGDHSKSNHDGDSDGDSDIYDDLEDDGDNMNCDGDTGEDGECRWCWYFVVRFYCTSYSFFMT